MRKCYAGISSVSEMRSPVYQTQQVFGRLAGHILVCVQGSFISVSEMSTQKKKNSLHLGHNHCIRICIAGALSEGDIMAEIGDERAPKACRWVKKRWAKSFHSTGIHFCHVEVKILFCHVEPISSKKIGDCSCHHNFLTLTLRPWQTIRRPKRSFNKINRLMFAFLLAAVNFTFTLKSF